MNTYSTAERAAYKAGCLAVERRIRGTLETMPEAFTGALEDLWAILGAADQSEAIKRAASLEKINAELSDIAVDRQNKIGELSRRCNELNESINAQRESANADFNALSDAKSKVQDALRNSERECNRLASRSNDLNELLNGAQRRIDDLSRTLSATKAMSEHYRKERDTLDSFITAARSDKSNPIFRSGYDAVFQAGIARLVGDKFNNKENFGDGFPIHEGPCKVEECANLGIATTAQLLDELKARAEVGGYSKYRTVDPV